MENKKEIVVGVIVLVAIILSVYFYSTTKKQASAPVVVAPVSSPEPKKTDFGNKAPDDFPSNIPVEQGAKITQGYSLEYPGQKQLTIVFSSTKTIKQNYDLYAAFLKKDGWTISNKYESANVSSLYGVKGNNDINVTISIGAGASVKSQVSISVLKK